MKTMSEFLYKRYDAEKTKEAINERITRAKASVIIIDKLLEYATEKQGQGLTKRLATWMKEALPQYDFAFCKEHGMYYLYVSGAELERGRFSILLGYESREEDKTLDPEIIKDRAMAYWLDRDRINGYEQSLNHVERFIDRMKEAQAIVKETEEEAAGYGIQYMLEVK